MREMIALFAVIGLMGLIPQPQEESYVDVLLLFAIPRCTPDTPVIQQPKRVWM